MRKEIITFKEPKSPISEIFRTLRTNVQFMNTKKDLKSILLTSTSPSEGKSWVSTNLAVTFAQAGKKVILVDADMRKGRQFAIFGVAPTPGFSNFLSGVDSRGNASNPDISKYIYQTEVENLYLIPAGNIPPNPSELLVSQQMIDALETLKGMCDLVIFDGTPVDLVTDSVILSRYVDTTIIVAAYKQTKIDSLKKLKKDIENVGGKIAGVVMNKMPISQKDYYATYYYYGSTSSMDGRKKSREEIKDEEELEIERRRIEYKEKAKEVLNQNKEITENLEDSNQSTDEVVNPLKESEELIQNMNNYIQEEKENFEKEE